MAYVPVVGWLYALLLQRKNAYVVFHAKQAMGLVLFLLAVLAGWAVVGWLLGWVPYGFIISTALFVLVAAATVFAALTLIIGIANALAGRVALLPIFGRQAHRLPL
jgi:uncharacterized membrane protein